MSRQPGQTSATLADAFGDRSQRWRIWSRRLPRGWPLLCVYLAVMGLFVVAGIFADWITPHDPTDQSLVNRLQDPVWQAGGTSEFFFGTDGLGRDILSRLIKGSQTSLLVIVTIIPGSLALGTAIGLIAGWRRGPFDSFAMRLVEVQLAFPAFLFALLIAAMLGPSLRNVIVILILFLWASYARLVRAEVLSLREREFVLAARTIGASDLRLMTRHLLPNVVNSVVILATLNVSIVIIAEASLSFLGAGAGPETISWGKMVAEGRDLLKIRFWLTGVPGITIMIVALVGNLLGDWLRDYLDPQLRNIQ